MSQLKSGALLTYANIALTNVIGILLTPFIIRSLGNSEYGLYTLIGSFVVYLSLMDLGINNTIIRFVAKYRAEKDSKGEEEFLGTTMIVYIGISFVLAILGMILYFNLDAVFGKSLTVDEMGKAKIMFLILVANLVITIPGGAFQAICNAYEHFVFPRTLTIIKYIFRAFCVFMVLYFGGKAISLVIIDSVLNLIIILITAVYVFRKLKVKLSIRRYDLSLVKGIFNYSFWVFLFGIVYKFQWNGGQVILGMNSNTVSVAIFGIGVMLGGYYGAFAAGINSVLIPRATQMIIQKKDGKTLTDSMIRVGRLNAFILLMILSGFFLFGHEFIELWVGNVYADSWLITFLIMLVMTMPLIQAFGNSILEAQRKNRFKSMVSLVTVSIAIVIGYFLSRTHGMFGIIVPLVVAMALNNMIMNYYYKKIFDFQIGYFFKETLLKSVLTYGILTFIAYEILQFFSLDSWFKLALAAALYGISYLGLTYGLLMNPSEKALIPRKK